MDLKKNTGRLAGLLLLGLILTGIFAEFFVRQKLYVPNDPSATTQNIIENEWLFRLGFVSDLVMSTLFFFYAYVLYCIFKHVNKNIALLLLLCVVISVAMLCQNALYQFSALEILSNKSYSETFNGNQLQALSMFFQNIHTKGYFVNQIFYGLYLFPLGYLVFRSGLVPRIIGVFLMLGCIGDLVSFLDYFLFPNHESAFINNITIPADIGEFSMCLWLLTMGIRSIDSPKVAINYFNRNLDLKK
ncbi:hypothetical protein ATO12_02630 [Aquimarina atlantica]|uniref:DUF4386 domain-containing protein n=1 Tax=Aquimarina atlantica TaxID=1317122 RepID=A0A023C0C1_9FLAO|nr:DUF4386 domain-containing protein [Aquimarina atlantica]EZH75705.1 hypothetical protein ATO12_02630 [Aquimarina atlantica]